MKIVILDGYASNPGDLDWKELEALGELTVYDRTAPPDTAAGSGMQTSSFSTKRPWMPKLLKMPVTLK